MVDTGIEGKPGLNGVQSRVELAVKEVGKEEAEEAAGEDILPVVPVVGDAGEGDESGADERGDKEHGLPKAALAVKEGHLAGEVEGEVAQSSKGSYWKAKSKK